LGNFLASEFYEPIFWNTPNTATVLSWLFFLLTPPMKMGQGVPKRWHIKFRHWEITQNKEYNIQNMAKFEIKKNQ
jgi:hypothetical protein